MRLNTAELNYRIFYYCTRFQLRVTTVKDANIIKATLAELSLSIALRLLLTIVYTLLLLRPNFFYILNAFLNILYINNCISKREFFFGFCVTRIVFSL